MRRHALGIGPEVVQWCVAPFFCMSLSFVCIRTGFAHIVYVITCRLYGVVCGEGICSTHTLGIATQSGVCIPEVFGCPQYAVMCGPVQYLVIISV